VVTGEFYMGANGPITLSRAREVIEIPSGMRATLPAGAVVRIMQSLGSGHTVATDRGYMYRVDAKDTNALGLSNAATAQAPQVHDGNFSEQMVSGSVEDRVRPGDSGQYRGSGSGLLVRDCAQEEGGNRIQIKMSMTAPGCGMGNVLKADVESRLSRLPSVKEVHVEVVFDPPWHPGLMSDTAKLQFGFDLDYGTIQTLPPIHVGRH
jgi:hypothetical protein